VNPRAAGQTLLGETVLPGLGALAQAPDMVDIFRNAEAAGPITDEAIALGAKVVWMQLGPRNDAAAARAEAEAIAAMMESVPIGVQLGLATGVEPTGGFMVMRGRERAHVVASPFPADTPPNGGLGVGSITAADEAVAAHQRVAEIAWRDALKGAAAAARVRDLIRSSAG